MLLKRKVPNNSPGAIVKKLKMSPSSWNSCWKNLHDLIFSDIMMIVGVESLENLQKSRQVCLSWNVMISQMTKHKKDSIKRHAESQAEMIKEEWVYGHCASLPEIVTAASLAHNDLLDEVGDMFLHNVDLASIPAEHIAALASCVTGTVDLTNVQCDLRPLLSVDVKYQNLGIENQILSSDETKAVVQAMKSTLSLVMIWGDVSLDIETLTQYTGKGRCRSMQCFFEDDRYLKEITNWIKMIEVENEFIVWYD